jgi:N-acetyl-gamma-glutamyl-phosphate reductase common form
MGGEALRILHEHPEAEVAWATSRSGKPIEEFHRNLFGSGLKLVSPEETTPCDAIFIAAPSGVAMEAAEKFLGEGAKVIDLGSDFRLEDQATWERVYGKKHTHWKLSEEAPYGIPELHREEIKKARLIANPGCFSSSVILGLAPIIKAGIVDTEKIVVDGISGTAGAGAELDVTMHHPEIGNNVVAYNVVDHRHSYEMEQELGNLTDDEVTVHFTSNYVPITRGIFSQCHCFPKSPVSRDQMLDLYKEFYKDEFFIKIFDAPKDPEASWQYKPYPWVAMTSGTNFCHIGLDVDEKRGRIVVFSALDSIGKGGAHAGVQNLNLLFGLDEKTGLQRYGNHPY